MTELEIHSMGLLMPKGWMSVEACLGDQAADQAQPTCSTDLLNRLSASAAEKLAVCGSYLCDPTNVPSWMWEWSEELLGRLGICVAQKQNPCLR
jgi:hypothetical protein